MTNDPFDPFDLPSSFDPLAPADPPPPRRRRVGGAASPSARHGLDTAAVGAVRGNAGGSTGPVGAGDRLAHLLLQTERASPPKGCEVGAGPTGNGTARLVALENEIAILAARVEALQTAIDDKLDTYRERLLRAVATALDQKRPRR